MVTMLAVRLAPGVAAAAIAIEFCRFRSTMERSPAPPGVAIAQLNRGSTAICGAGPEFKLTDPTTQGGLGFEPVRQGCVLVVPAKAINKPLLVEE